MNLIRQEKLLKTLFKYRFRKYNIGLIKIEAYDTFEDNKYMCRLEVFRGGTRPQHRLLKYEAFLDENFAQNADKRLRKIIEVLEKFQT